MPTAMAIQFIITLNAKRLVLAIGIKCVNYTILQRYCM